MGRWSQSAAAMAREHHPSATWRPDRDRFLSVLAQRLSGEGSRWPHFVSAVLETRARLRVGPERFAEMLGVEASVVADLEAGRVPPSRAPLSLVRLAPDVDWPAVVAADEPHPWSVLPSDGPA